MALAEMRNKPFDPIDIRLLGADAVMLDADFLAHLVEQANAFAYPEPRKGLYPFLTPKRGYAIFVDAGYFFAAGAQAAFGPRTPPITRKQVSVKSSRAMLDALCHGAAATTGNLPLLRVYWYDAMPGPRMSLDQSALALLSGVKLRLGALNSAGEQKGVDSLIVTDIIDLARNRAISDAVVVTGDEDLRIAFQVAQSFGVRVHILAAGDPTKNVSPSLQMGADSVTALDSAWFGSHFDLTAPTATSSPPPPGRASETPR